MTSKQGEENTKILKQDDRTGNFIFQKNTKTKIAANNVPIVLIAILGGIILSGVFLDS